MTDDWRLGTIAEVSDKVAMGPFGSSIKVATFVSEGVPVISGKHLKEFRLNEHAGFNFVTEDHADKLKNANVKRGDVIFTHAGNIGQVAYIPETSKYGRYIISQRQFYMQCNKNKVIPEFVALYFKSPMGQHQLLANASQVGVPSIAQPVSYLRTIEIPLPPLPEQHAIAHILGTLDDKIELNRRMNETLEEMARVLFKSWFVDFDPVRTKTEDRNPSLPKGLADLFPGRLVNSELGEIPEGWEVKTVSSFGEIVTGKTPSTKEPAYFGDDVPFLRIPDMHGKMYALQTHVMLSSRGANSQPQKTIPPGSISVSCIATPGLVVLNHRNIQTNQQINSIIPRNQSLSKYLYWSCKHLSTDIKTGGVGGSVFDNMNKSTFSALPVLNPKPTVISTFDQFVSPMHATILANEKHNQILTQMCDTLLPELITGHLRVKDAEDFLEKVL